MVAHRGGAQEDGPRGARELARDLEAKLGMPARERPRLSESHPAPRVADRPPRRGLMSTGLPPRVILPPVHPKRSMDGGEVAGALIGALLFGLIAAGLAWLAVGLV
jgi:hypothetical protein